MSGKTVQKLLILVLLVCCVCIQNATGVRRMFRHRLKGDQLTKPFVLFYEHESFRGEWFLHGFIRFWEYKKKNSSAYCYLRLGKEYVQHITKDCINLPKEYSDWASSVDTHRACASICTSENCAGPCHNVYSNQGMSKLRVIGFNDKIKSVRSCFWRSSPEWQFLQ